MLPQKYAKVYYIYNTNAKLLLLGLLFSVLLKVFLSEPICIVHSY